MRIFSYYTDYYSQKIATNPTSNALKRSTTKVSSEEETDSTIFMPTRKSDKNSNTVNLTFNGQMLKDSLFVQGMDDSEGHEKMEKLRTDMDSLLEIDIDSLSSEEIKDLLTTLKTDMEGLPNREGNNDLSDMDIESMSETDMRELLEKIQERIKDMSEEGNRMPPPPPPMMDMMQAFSSESSTTEGEDSSSNELQEIVDKLLESFDSTSESRDTYITRLKETIELIQQGMGISDFSSSLFGMLDEWNSQQVTDSDIITKSL